MSKIKADFVGVIHLPDHGLVLKAGDDIPEGVVIGDHAAEPDAKSDSKPGWDGKNVDELKAEIERRNQDREDDAKVVPGGKGNKPDLVQALVDDDEKLAAAGGE